MEFSAEARRTAAFEMIRDVTLGVLTSPRGEDALQGRERQLIAALESSFVVQQRRGKLVIPPEQQVSDNVAIHPVLPTDLREPTYYIADVLRASDRARFADDNPKLFGELQRELSHPRPRIGLGAYLRPQASPYVWGGLRRFVDDDNRLQLRLPERPVVVIPIRGLRLLGGFAYASLVAHEIDHAVKWRDLFHQKRLREFVFDDSNEGADWVGASVLMERSAYDVTERLLSSARRSPVSIKQLAKHMRHMGPEEAGVSIKRLCDNKRIAPTLVDELHVVSSHARALTRVFSGGYHPSWEEVVAYKAAGHIHSVEMLS